jgi:Cd2+/Zn2+-exporting ATPase
MKARCQGRQDGERSGDAKSPTQRFTDRFERIFVPAVLILSVLLCSLGSSSTSRSATASIARWRCWWRQALRACDRHAERGAVGRRRAARGGVLVKGGAPLENLGSLKAIAFDKTGTLTEGRRASLMSCRSMAPMKASCWRWPAVEALSDHPLAQAIVKDAANV